MSSATMPEMKPYPEYKESGTSWVGKVPSHWKVLPNRAIFVEVNDQNHPHDPMLSVTINQGVISQKELLEDNSQRDGSRDDKSSYKLVLPGDIAYNKMRAWQGAIGLSNHKGIVSPAYVVQRPIDGLNPHYLHLLLRTPSFATEAERWSYGITSDMWSLRPQHFKAIHSCVPPADEQAAIVRYLDDAEQRIRAYVSAKERLIALLEEERQAVIHQAVTKGLDPNVKLKPSDVEWLGDVPEHWEVTALYHKYSQILGKMLDAKKVVGDHLLPYLRNTDVQWDRINVDDLPTMDISPNEYERYTVRPGDLLVCEGGDVGRSALWSGELAICGFQKALHRLRSIRGDIPRFLYYVLRVASNRDVFNDGHVSTIAHLTGEKLRLHRFPFPPIPEQSAIVEHLDKATAETDTAIDHAHRQIELMEEYRTRLIADVVTGKIDIRRI